MERCPDCGTQLSAGPSALGRSSSCPKFRRARLYRQELSTCPVCPQRNWTAWCWGSVSASTCSAWPRCKPDCPCDHDQRSGHRASVAPVCGSRDVRPSSRTEQAGPTGGGSDCGPHPRQPSGTCRRNGLVQDGNNGTSGSTPTQRYFLRRARRWWMEVLGEGFAGVLWSADSTPPTTLRRCFQKRCWLRDIHDLRALSMMRHWPGGPTPSTGFTTGQSLHSSPGQAAAHRPSGLERLAICQPFLDDPSCKGQIVPTHRPHQRTLRLRGGPRRRTTTPPSAACATSHPQDQLGHSGAQDDLACFGTWFAQGSICPAARLNCYSCGPCR